jgi:hypothetical protein
MNFIKPSTVTLKKPDGTVHKNKILNLDTVITFKKMVHNSSPPEWWVIEFACVDSQQRSWYYKTEKDMDEVYDKLISYIITSQNQI